jgi:hypothetical protein
MAGGTVARTTAGRFAPAFAVFNFAFVLVFRTSMGASLFGWLDAGTNTRAA